MVHARAELQLRDITEHAQHVGGLFQQIPYIVLVACGATLVSRGELPWAH